MDNLYNDTVRVKCINCGEESEIGREFAIEDYIDGTCPFEMKETVFKVIREK